MDDSRPANEIDKQDLRHLVFVYGTLKTGFCRNEWLSMSQLIGTSRTQPSYRMVDCGEYPGLIRTAQDGIEVEGEIWRVSDQTLEKLDQVEAVDEGLYERTVIELTDSFPTPVQGYLYCRSTVGMADCGKCWTKGHDGA